MAYNKLIFVSKENVTLSPMAEWMMKSILMDKSKVILSRGLVVLFPEPQNKKVTDLLVLHGIPCEEQFSEKMSMDDIDGNTLILAMNFTEKVKILEEYELGEWEENVFTLQEFAEEEEEPIDPYGEDEEGYEACYIQLKDLLYKVKKKLEWE